MHEIDMKLVIAMARSYNQIFSRIEKSVQAYGLTTSEFGVLEFLLHKGEQPVQKVAEKILVTSGTISYIIDKLEKKNLVVREKCKLDKRVYYVKLTDNGKKFIETIFPQHRLFLEQLFQQLDPDFKEKLILELIELQKKTED